MNFFEHQDQARRNTTQLIILFFLAIAAMIATFYLVAIFSIQASLEGQFRFWHPGILFLVSLGTLSIIGVGSFTKMAELRRGGVAVAESLGGLRVNPQTEDFKEKQLLNVVAEMALASGTPLPTVYLLAREEGINAFAAGYTPDDAVIGVTRGCLEQLSREELQGVIAHEFSHILNGDMRLNLKLIGVLQGLLFIYILGRFLSSGSSGHHSRRDNDNKVALFGLAMVVVGGIGLIFGRLIKSAVSRQREFLADAAAVQFTRNPEGLAGALRRIGGYTQGSKMRTPKAEEASHLFFGEAVNTAFMDSWMATHPPLPERIRRITGVEVAATGARPPSGTSGLAAAGAMGLQESAPPAIANSPETAATSTPHSQNPDEFVARIGTATTQDLDKAHQFLASLPVAMGEALRSPTGAMAIVYAFLLDQKPEVRSRQMTLLQAASDLVEPPQVSQMAEQLSLLNSRQYLPLLDLTIPALRTLTPPQCAQFFKQIQALVKADGRLSLSEYVLQLILQKRLRPHFQKNLEPPKAVTHLDMVWHDCQVVLTVLARIGHKQPDDAFYAFKSGMGRLPGAHQREMPPTLPTVSLTDLGQSLKRLEPLVPKLKQAMVDAAAHTVLVDNTVSPQEAELLRAIVITLDCPIPPFLEAVRQPDKVSAPAH